MGHPKGGLKLLPFTLPSFPKKNNHENLLFKTRWNHHGLPLPRRLKSRPRGPLPRPDKMNHLLQLPGKAKILFLSEDGRNALRNRSPPRDSPSFPALLAIIRERPVSGQLRELLPKWEQKQASGGLPTLTTEIGPIFSAGLRSSPLGGDPAALQRSFFLGGRLGYHSDYRE